MEGKLVQILALLSTMVLTTSGQFSLMSQWTGKCVSMKNWNTGSNLPLIGGPCVVGGGNQAWTTTYVGMTAANIPMYQLINPISNLCLSITGGSVNNAQIVQFQCVAGGLNQLWVFTAFNSTSYWTQVQNPQSGRCLTTNNAADNTIMTVYDCISPPGVAGNPPNQWWYFLSP